MEGRLVVILHGGMCCGMTHIYRFPNTPNEMCQARLKKTGEQYATFLVNYPSCRRWVNDTRPAETAGERLRELVRLIPSSNGLSGEVYTNRRSGIIEVVLTSRGGMGTAENWRSLLEELGFKEVNRHLNSNTNNILHVFHLNIGAA